MRRVGELCRRAGVAEIYLVHGTFVGPDAIGILGELGRVYPEVGSLIQNISKQAVDKMTRDAGNYTGSYAQTFEDAINLPGEPRIPVERFYWSSQNNHIGRADGAVRLIDRLYCREPRPRGRVLLWGHSHAGNVFSLVTNLLAAEPDVLEEFFSAARIYYRWPLLGCVDIPVWRRVRLLLTKRREQLEGTQLDIVTFGTPVRYGWDSDGYSRLLHFVNHRPTRDLPNYQAPFPPTPDRVLAAADGDYIQQLGIAGTNILPSIFSWRSWIADHRLNDLLQPGLQRRDLIDRFRAGVRVAEEGTTLLVDYGLPEEGIGHHVAGHAVYTQSEWLQFHAEEVARRFYADA